MFLADEIPGGYISEFVGLRAKVYSINAVSENPKERSKTKCKGVKSAVVPDHEAYKDCLLNGRIFMVSSNHITSKKHCVTTEQRVKIALRNSDDKRFIESDGITTLALGHKDSAHHRDLTVNHLEAMGVLTDDAELTSVGGFLPENTITITPVLDFFDSGEIYD